MQIRFTEAQGTTPRRCEHCGANFTTLVVTSADGWSKRAAAQASGEWEAQLSAQNSDAYPQCGKLPVAEAKRRSDAGRATWKMLFRVTSVLGMLSTLFLLFEGFTTFISGLVMSLAWYYFGWRFARSGFLDDLDYNRGAMARRRKNAGWQSGVSISRGNPGIEAWMWIAVLLLLLAAGALAFIPVQLGRGKPPSAVPFFLLGAAGYLGSIIGLRRYSFG